MRLSEAEIQEAWERYANVPDTGWNDEGSPAPGFADALQRVADRIPEPPEIKLADFHDFVHRECKTLRDEFAMAALGELVREWRDETSKENHGWTPIDDREEGALSDAQVIADEAYAMADAMLSARAKGAG